MMIDLQDDGNDEDRWRKVKIMVMGMEDNGDNDGDDYGSWRW